MALPAWPGTLPKLVGEQGNLGTSALYAAPLKTEMDDGPSRLRRRKLYRETPRSITMLLTRAQFVTFKTFVTTTLNDGASRFTAQVRTPAGTLATKTVRIEGDVTESDEGPRSRVSFTIVVADW